MKLFWTIVITLSLGVNIVLLSVIGFYFNTAKYTQLDNLMFQASANRICRSEPNLQSPIKELCEAMNSLGNRQDKNVGNIVPKAMPNQQATDIPSSNLAINEGESSQPSQAPESVNTRGFIYVDMHGYSLTFPESWAGYTTSPRDLDWGIYGTSDSMDFGFPIQDSLFNISVHTPDQWEGIHTEGGPAPIKLGENDKYVFGYAVAQFAEDDEVIARMAEVKYIVDSFELIDLDAR